MSPMDSVSNCKTLSENKKLSNPENLKKKIKTSQITRLCPNQKHYQTTTNQFYQT